MPRFKIDIIRRPCDGKYQFADDESDAPILWTREEVEATAKACVGPGRLAENVDGIFWVCPDPEPNANEAPEGANRPVR